MIDEEFVTLEDFAEHLQYTGGARSEKDSKKLREHLDAAIEVVQAHVGPLTPERRTVRLRQNGKHLVLPITRIGEVVSVTDPHGVGVREQDLDVNHLAGIVTLPWARAGSWSVVVEPSAGAASLRLAVKIIGAHLWATQRGASARPAGMRSGGNDDVVSTGFGYAIPRRAAELMAVHQSPTIA